MTQETLEEFEIAALKYNEQFIGGQESRYAAEDFINGAKWQQERSYSEEDMIEFAYNYIDERRDQGARAMTPELLIKQFKNK